MILNSESVYRSFMYGDQYICSYYEIIVEFISTMWEDGRHH